MSADRIDWRGRVSDSIRSFLPYLHYVLFFAVILGILITSILQQFDLAIRGLFMGIPALVGAFVLQSLYKKDLTFSDSLVLFPFNPRLLMIFFACLFSISLFLLSIGLGRTWLYPTVVTLLYVNILIQIFSNKSSKVVPLVEIMLTQAEFVWSSIIKYDFYFGGTDIMPHQFMATITYLSGHILPSSFDAYAYFPLYHVFLAECSHILGFNIWTSIYSVTWPISVIGVVFIYYIFLRMVKNEQIALLTSLLYSILALGLTHSVYMIPRSLAFVGFLILLYSVISLSYCKMSSNSMTNKYFSYYVIATMMVFFIVLVHQVSVILIIVLFCILVACEWFVDRQKYIPKLFFLFMILFSVAYWIYVAFSFTRSLMISRFDVDLLANPEVVRATDLSSAWAFCINFVGKEILLFFAVIGIGYILYRKKLDYLTVLALFTSITLLLYIPNPLQMIWQILNLFGFERFILLLGPFMAFIMGIGVYILFQYLLKTNSPINKICILLIAIIFIFGSSATGLLYVDSTITRQYFNSDELRGLDFVCQYVPYGSSIYTDYYSVRYLDKPHFGGSEILGIPYYCTNIILGLDEIPSYGGYSVLPYKEFLEHGLSLGIGSDFVAQSLYPCYPTDDNVIMMRTGFDPKNKLYTNHAIDVYLS